VLVAAVVEWLTGATVVPLACEILFVDVSFCCLGEGEAAASVVVGFVAAVFCVGGDDDDDTVDVGSVVADDGKDGFTVLEIPHIRASVVLTTLRSGLLGSHIFALSSDDIDLLTLGEDNVGEDDFCAYTWILLQIPKSNTPTRSKNSAKIEIILIILKIQQVLLFMHINYKLSSFLYCYCTVKNSRKD
jgi:hypothetical protein